MLVTRPVCVECLCEWCAPGKRRCQGCQESRDQRQAFDVAVRTIAP
jgi:hypothetical protein